MSNLRFVLAAIVSVCRNVRRRILGVAKLSGDDGSRRAGEAGHARADTGAARPPWCLRRRWRPSSSQRRRSSRKRSGRRRGTPLRPRPATRNPDATRCALTAIQAATAYADGAMRSSQQGRIHGCRLDLCTRDDARATNGMPAPSTAMDQRVREAMHAALSAGGIARQDFPAGAEPWVAAMVPSHRARLPSCATPRQADRRTR